MKVSVWGAAGLALVTAATATGCGDSGSGLPTMGMLGVPASALVAGNVILVDASLNGHPGGRLLIDTGAPLTLINPGEFPGATLLPMTQVTVNIGVGAITIDAVPALQLVAGAMNDLHVGGILGGNVVRQFSTELNYRDHQLRLGAGTEPADVEQPGASAAFTIQGGGTLMAGQETLTYPATRIPITVTIEGVDHGFILDSGASEVTLRTTLFASLVADGRSILHGLPISTVSGNASADVSRVRTVSVAGEAVSNVPVMTLGDNALLDHLTGEVGHPIDGLLGGSYLREFLVTIDYPRGTLRLQRYANRAHIVDEFQKIGVVLVPNPGYQVSVVYAGSDAQKKGILARDQLLTIDGQTIDLLDTMTVEHMIEGAVGTTHRLGFGAAGNAAVAFQTIDVLVDDLVPALQLM